MKVVIIGGRTRTDYLVESLVNGGHKVTVINRDRDLCEYLSNLYESIDVVCGNGTKRYVLDDANIDGFDIAIALTNVDADNFIICQLARHFYNIERQICTVSDPRNIDVFRKLGVSAAISGTYTIAKAIEKVSFEAVEGRLATEPDGTGMMRALDSELAEQRFNTSSFHRIAKL
jgi:trk system potassium uptake protein TrkA